MQFLFKYKYNEKNIHIDMKLFNPLKNAMGSETLEAAAEFNFGIKKSTSLIS